MTDRLIPLLGEGHVQVWQMRVDEPAVEACAALLSEEEHARLHRMRLGMARNEFVVGRAMLRVLVGAVLEMPATQISISTGDFGKPSVARIEFSVAHSHGNILIALCRNSRVGVDIEWIDKDIETVEIAQQSFSRGEISRLEHREDEQRLLAFYDIWTKKEAMVKAHGQGLTLDLESFTAPEDDALALVDGEQLFVQKLASEPGYAAALASVFADLVVERHELESQEIVVLARKSQ